MLTFLLFLFLLIGMCTSLGWLVLVALRGRETDPALDWLENGFASLSLGVGLLGWLAIILAELDWFSLRALAGCWLVLMIGLVIWHGRQGRGWRAFGLKPHPTYLALLPWLIMAGWLFTRPHESIQGGADAGVYVSLAGQIARTGQIVVEDDLLAGLDATLNEAFLRPLPEQNFAPAYFVPGFYTSDTPGELPPQFYPLHPIWLAVAFAFGDDPVTGTGLALRLVGVWAMMGSLGVFFTVRRLAGNGAACLALAAMTVNALQIWFARYPVTESLTQYLLWTGLWSFGLWWEGVLQGKSRPQWGLLAGLMLGSTQLVRIDMFFVLVVPGAAFLYLLVKVSPDSWQTRAGENGRNSGKLIGTLGTHRNSLSTQHSVLSTLFSGKSSYIWFFIPTLTLTLHSVIHALWQSRPYFFDTFGYVFRYAQSHPALMAVGVAGLLLFVLGGWVGRGRVQIPPVWEQRLRQGLALLVVLWGVYGGFIRPAVEGARQFNDWYSETAIPVLDAINFWRLGWYLSPLGVGLGVVAMAWLVWRVDRRTLPWLAVGLMFSLLYLWRTQASQHQIYTMRRYVPVVMPFFLSAAAIFLTHFIMPLRNMIHRKDAENAEKRENLRQSRNTDGMTSSQSSTEFLRVPTSSALALLVTVIWLGGLTWLSRGFVTQMDHAGLVAKLAEFDAQLPENAVLLFNDPAPVGVADFVGTPLRFIWGREMLVIRDAAALDPIAFRAQLRHWQAEGRSLYWVTVPGSPPWPLTDWPLLAGSVYPISTEALEGTYDRRPTQINQIVWEMTLIPIPALDDE